MSNYIIVLFKNKKKRRIIKGYATKVNAKNKFKALLDTNNIIFNMLYENAEEVKFELALLSKVDKYQPSLYKQDDLGRNEKVFIEDDNCEYVILDIVDYDLEEKIYDWQKKKRISFNYLIDEYCKEKEFKSIFTLHNKLVIQVNEIFNLFSLKNISDSERLLRTIEQYYRTNNRSDAMFIRDISTAQRKWIYDVLVEKGYNKGLLYREKTTFSKRI